MSVRLAGVGSLPDRTQNAGTGVRPSTPPSKHEAVARKLFSRPTPPMQRTHNTPASGPLPSRDSNDPLEAAETAEEANQMTRGRSRHEESGATEVPSGAESTSSLSLSLYLSTAEQTRRRWRYTQQLFTAVAGPNFHSRVACARAPARPVNVAVSSGTTRTHLDRDNNRGTPGSTTRGRESTLQRAKGTCKSDAILQRKDGRETLQRRVMTRYCY